jgi:hypothetical protein
LVAIVLLAFGLRLYGLGAGSLWYDETVSVHLAGKSLPALIAHTAGDIHPPGYYLLLHAWTRVAGNGGLAAAFPSLVFGMLLVVLAYWTGERVFSDRAGLLAAFLVAISPYNIWYSQEVRMYTLGAALGMGVLGAVILLGVGTTGGRRRDAGWLVVYSVLAALGLWTLYYFAFLLVAMNIIVGAWWIVAARRRVGWTWLGRWMLAQGAVLLLYAPWIPIAWRQATEPPVPPWRGVTSLGSVLAETWSALCLGQSVDPAQVWPALLLFAMLFVLGLLSRSRMVGLKGEAPSSGALTWVLGGHVFLPVLLIYVASFITPLYHVRYMFTYSTPFYVIIGGGLSWLWQRWRPIAWLSLAVVAVLSGFSLYAYHTDPRYASDDHQAAVRFLAERWRPGDAILVNAGYAYPALLTYWDGEDLAWRGRLADIDRVDAAGRGVERPVVFQTGSVDGDPELGWGDAASDFYAMSWADTSASLQRLFSDFDRVWVYRIYDTVTDPEGRIRSWLEQHGTQYEDRLFEGEAFLRVQGFLTGRDPLASMDGADGVIYDGASAEELASGTLQLAGRTALPPEVEVGSAVDLALVWRVKAPPTEGHPDSEGEWILFVGLYDSLGRLWAQVDERGSGSLFPVSAWPEGSVVRSPLRIEVPTGTPPGEYEVEVGWYRFVDGQPVWLPWLSGDRLNLGRVEVVAPEDWWSLPGPTVAYPAGVTIGSDILLLGFDAQTLEGYPGQDVELGLVWQALADSPEAGLVVLQLKDDAGRILQERASVPADGQAPFFRLEAGQTIRDAQRLTLLGQLKPGVYSLAMGRRRPDDTWLPVQRRPFGLGSSYPLATIRVLRRPMDLVRPTVQHPVTARFGDRIQLLGYNLETGSEQLAVTLFWQALSSTESRIKMFVHLVGVGGAGDIRAQADLYPRLPSTSWVPGEYLSDEVTLDLSGDLTEQEYALLVGWYDEATGDRLPVLDSGGKPVGGSLQLERFEPRE